MRNTKKNSKKIRKSIRKRNRTLRKTKTIKNKKGGELKPILGLDKLIVGDYYIIEFVNSEDAELIEKKVAPFYNGVYQLQQIKELKSGEESGAVEYAIFENKSRNVKFSVFFSNELHIDIPLHFYVYLTSLKPGTVDPKLIDNEEGIDPEDEINADYIVDWYNYAPCIIKPYLPPLENVNAARVSRKNPTTPLPHDVEKIIKSYLR